MVFGANFFLCLEPCRSRILHTGLDIVQKLDHVKDRWAILWTVGPSLLHEFHKFHFNVTSLAVSVVDKGKLPLCQDLFLDDIIVVVIMKGPQPSQQCIQVVSHAIDVDLLIHRLTQKLFG